MQNKHIQPKRKIMAKFSSLLPILNLRRPSIWAPPRRKKLKASWKFLRRSMAFRLLVARSCNPIQSKKPKREPSNQMIKIRKTTKVLHLHLRRTKQRPLSQIANWQPARRLFLTKRPRKRRKVHLSCISKSKGTSKMHLRITIWVPRRNTWS